MDAVQLRDLFNAPKALIDAQPATSYGRVAADWTSGSASFGDVTGLTFPVAAGESWTADLVLAVLSGTTGQGLKFRVSEPGAGSVLIAMRRTGSGRHLDGDGLRGAGGVLSAFAGEDVLREAEFGACRAHPCSGYECERGGHCSFRRATAAAAGR